MSYLEWIVKTNNIDWKYIQDLDVHIQAEVQEIVGWIWKLKIEYENFMILIDKSIHVWIYKSDFCLEIERAY